MIRAAGILFRAKDGRCLFLQRGSGGDAAGTWVPPGGKIEGDETPEQAAIRESVEEAGSKAKAAAKNLKLLARRIAPVAPTPLDVPEGPTTLAVRDDVVDFTTFLVDVDEPFDVELDDENTAFAWAPADSPPEPLHPGARVALAKLSANELDVARMMAAGDLTSPQFFANVMLLDIRITGTGVAYRKAHDEYCFRAEENYLNPEFLARCNGLPVLWEHPAKATLDSKEWSDRAVGTTFLPYIKGDEVWGIVKIYDAMAIEELTSGEDWSTSPTVDFGAGVVLQDVNTTGVVKLEDGSEVKMLVEGDPPLLDHIAICPKGVWDKGGAPSGVNTARADGAMADEDEKKREDAARAAADKAKADAEDDKFKKIMDAMGGVAKLADSVSSLTSRMDAWDEEKKKADAAKADAAKKADEGEKEEKKANEAANEPGAGDPKEVERKEADKKSDAAKKDEEDEKKREDAAKAKADTARADAEARDRRIEELERRLNAQTRSDDDRNAIGHAHARADSAFQKWGKQAPNPFPEESALSYRRRIANELKSHSDNWKDSDLSRMDMNTFVGVEKGIYADAEVASRNPATFSDGELRQVKVPDAYGIGHRIEFHGRPSWWMDDFKQQPLKARFGRRTAN